MNDEQPSPAPTAYAWPAEDDRPIPDPGAAVWYFMAGEFNDDAPDEISDAADEAAPPLIEADGDPVAFFAAYAEDDVEAGAAQLAAPAGVLAGLELLLHQLAPLRRTPGLFAPPGGGRCRHRSTSPVP